MPLHSPSSLHPYKLLSSPAIFYSKQNMKNEPSIPTIKKKWYERIPHAVTMLFCIIVLVTIMTYILPAGSFERELIDGRSRVVPGSYKEIPSTPVGLLDMFKAIPLGFKSAVEIIFVVLAGGIMFGIMEKSKAVEKTGRNPFGA